MSKATTNAADGGRVFFTEATRLFLFLDLIAHQKDSWEDFVKSGLREVFNELNPIDDYTGAKLSLLGLKTITLRLQSKTRKPLSITYQLMRRLACYGGTY